MQLGQIFACALKLAPDAVPVLDAPGHADVHATGRKGFFDESLGRFDIGPTFNLVDLDGCFQLRVLSRMEVLEGQVL